MSADVKAMGPVSWVQAFMVFAPNIPFLSTEGGYCEVSTSGPSSEIDRASQDTEAANNRSPNRQRKKTPAMPARNGQEDQPQEETVMSLLKESLSQRQTQLKIPSSGGSCEKLAPRCPTSTTEFTEEEHDFWTHQTMTRLRWS